jgi:hypothetical protein
VLVDDPKFTIGRKDEHSPWVVTFTYGSLSHPMPVTGSLAQVEHFAGFAMEGLKAAVAQDRQDGLYAHIEQRFADWIRVQFVERNS